MAGSHTLSSHEELGVTASIEKHFSAVGLGACGSRGSLPVNGWREGVKVLGQSIKPEAPAGVKSREKLALNCAAEAVWSQRNTKLQSRHLGLQKNSHLRS